LRTALGTIRGGADGVSVAAQEIAAGNLGAVAELDRMTQQNAALVEESAAAAQSLKDQSGQLASAIAGFNIGAAGTGTYNNTSRAPDSANRAKPLATPKAVASEVIAKVTKKATGASAARTTARAAAKPAAASSGNDDWESF
jgi:methyl-accepting chemotaxis protein